VTTLPVIARQLWVRARSPAGHWTRFGAALAGTLLCLVTLAGDPSPARTGAAAFEGLVMAAFILCCFSGLLTVDGISRERREGTLGLLFLTRVRALDVLLGNFGAAGIASLCALAALAPVVLLPVLAGGVTGGEAARQVLALFDTMILSLAAGLWASAGGRGWLSCARSAAALLLLIVAGPLLLRSLIPRLPMGYSWPDSWSAIQAAKDVDYRKAAAPYWISIASVHAISWLLVIGAGIRLRRVWREDAERPDRYLGPAPRRQALAPGEPPPHFEFIVYKIPLKRTPLAVGDAPLDWLMHRQRGIRTVVWAGVLFHGLFYYGYYGGSPFYARLIRGSSGVYSLWGVNLAFAVVQGSFFAWAASRFFIEARRSGELETLLITPEGAKSIIASQWKWLKNVFLGPVVVLLLPWAAQAIINFLPGSSFRRYAFREGDAALYYFMATMFSGMSIVLGTGALLWAGLWFGWSERSYARAIVRNVVVTKGGNFLIFILGNLVITNIVPPLAPRSLLPRLIPQALILLFYLWLIKWARQRLAGDLPLAGTG
jgi:hypothetical protein